MAKKAVKKQSANGRTESLYIRLPVDDHLRLCWLANLDVGDPKVKRPQALCLKIPHSVHEKLMELVVKRTAERSRQTTKQEVVIGLINKAKKSEIHEDPRRPQRKTKQSVVISLIEAA